MCRTQCDQACSVADYCEWVIHGPCTTRQLAEKSAIDILNVRPRTTDLVQIGLVEMIGGGQEGIYRARSQAEWEAWAAAQRPALDGQIALI